MYVMIQFEGKRGGIRRVRGKLSKGMKTKIL